MMEQASSTDGVLTRAAWRRRTKQLVEEEEERPTTSQASLPSVKRKLRSSVKTDVKEEEQRGKEKQKWKQQQQQQQQQQQRGEGHTLPHGGRVTLPPSSVPPFIEAGSFVAVAGDSENEPFWLARLLEAMGGASASPGDSKSLPPSEASGDNNRRRQWKTGRRTKKVTEGQQLVRVRWMEPRPPRGGSKGAGGSSCCAFEEFVEGGTEGAIVAESVLCRVRPEPLPAHDAATGARVWRLRRLDKLRIYRVPDRPGPAVEWLTSHLLPDRIIWSSHPSLLKPDIAFDFSAEERLLQEAPDQEEPLQTPPEPARASYDAETQKLFKRAARLLRDSPAVLVMAGAGMGKDSGLPDYRGAQGFWRSYPPLAKLGITFNETMEPSWFEKDPHQAWGFYGHRADLYANTTPHAGFEVIRRISGSKPGNFFLLTSNIDGQFQKAGFAEECIYECHGSLEYLQCTKPCTKKIWPLDPNLIPRVDMDTLRVPPDKEAFPRCPVCHGLARPNVSLAGDTQDTWVEARSLEQKKRLLRWLRRIMRGTDDLEASMADGDDTIQEGRGENGGTRGTGGEETTRMPFDFLMVEKEEFECFSEWREVCSGRKQKRPSSEPHMQGSDSNQQCDLSPAKRQKRNKAKMVVLELGCGDSLHSLRIEAELMVRENPSVKLIRINPNFQGKVKRGHIAIKLGALQALTEINKYLRCQKPSDLLTEPSSALTNIPNERTTIRPPPRSLGVSTQHPLQPPSYYFLHSIFPQPLLARHLNHATYFPPCWSQQPSISTHPPLSLHCASPLNFHYVWPAPSL